MISTLIFPQRLCVWQLLPCGSASALLCIHPELRPPSIDTLRSCVTCSITRSVLPFGSISSNLPVSVSTARQRCGCNWQFLLWPFPNKRMNSRSQKLLCSAKVSAHTPTLHLRRAPERDVPVQLANAFLHVQASVHDQKSHAQESIHTHRIAEAPCLTSHTQEDPVILHPLPLQQALRHVRWGVLG